MHKLNELAQRLTPAHVKEVEDFAEFLLSRQPGDGDQPSLVERGGETYVNVDAIAGMFAGLAPGKSDVELADEAREAICDKYDKYFK